VGGTLQVKLPDQDEPNSRGRGKDKKVYAARYTAPAVQQANDALMGDQPAAAPDINSVLSQLSPEQQRALLAQAGQQHSSAPPF
jgi:hypothetical protein